MIIDPRFSRTSKRLYRTTAMILPGREKCAPRSASLLGARAIFRLEELGLFDPGNHRPLLHSRERRLARCNRRPADRARRYGRSWLRDQFGAAVTTGVRQWGILYPPPLDRDSDGNIRMGSLSELFLGFSDCGDDGWSEDAIAVQIEKQAVTIKHSAEQKRVASIVIPSELDNYPLILTWGARALQPILRERRPRFEQAVEITFRTGDGLANAALHQIAAAALLTSGPRRTRGHRINPYPTRSCRNAGRSQGDTRWTEMARLDGMGSTSALNAEQLAVLTTWLRKRSSMSVSVSDVSANLRQVQKMQLQLHTALSKSLRNRIEWYLRLTVQGSARYAIGSLSDAAIVKAVSAPNRNPAAVARQNLLLNELKIETGYYS